MTLRWRLAWTVLLTAIPLTAGMIWLRRDLEARAAVRALRDYIVERMEEGGREECEAAPAEFPRRPPRPGPRRPPPDDGRYPGGRKGPGKGKGWPGGEPPPRPGRDGPPPRPPSRITLAAYNASFQSDNPLSPSFPLDLKAELDRGAEHAGSELVLDGKRGLQVAVRMPWRDGPCAVVLGRNREPGEPEGVMRVLSPALTITGGLLLAVLLAAGPIVRRILRLTAAVRRSAADRYATPVEVAGGDEIAQLATAFNEAGAELRTHVTQLEERERTLKSFVANTTHDVMLPLTVLQGHLSEMRRRLEAGTGIDRELVGDSLEEAHYMASLLHNLGAAVKLEAGASQFQRHPLRLDELVERVIHRHRPIARELAVALEYSLPELPAWVDGDVTLLEQAVSNVTHNAVRYNRPGGHVSIILEVKAGEAPRFSLRVIDDGPGISDADLARITERSFRTDEARRRHPGGLGLGLHITRGVAEAHSFDLQLRRSGFGGLEVELQGPVIRPPG